MCNEKWRLQNHGNRTLVATYDLPVALWFEVDIASPDKN